MTTPRGARGLVHRFDVRDIPAGTTLTATLTATPGAGTTVGALQLQVRR